MSDKKKVWDIAVRVFHWSLVLFFATAYLTGDDADTLHAYAGYIIIGLLGFRFIWGFIGTRTARFRSFIFSPAETMRYARSFVTRNPIHYIGHNPLGSLMVFALLLFISLTCWSGLKLYAIEGKGPLAQDVNLVISQAYADDEHEREGHDKSEHRFWKDVHELFANFTLFLVIMHILGAVLASIVHGENLIKAMITGRRERVDDQGVHTASSSVSHDS